MSPSNSWFERLDRIDRRWIFLLMFLAVSGPILWIGITGKTLPEAPTLAAKAAFDEIDKLPAKSLVLFSFDYDPASSGELQPMATALMHQCAQKGLRIVFIALWPLGNQMAQQTIQEVIRTDYPAMREGEDFVNMGFQAGNEAVMKLLLTDFAIAFPKDSRGEATSTIPILKGVKSVGDFPLLISVSAGYPGSKEWVQYVVSARNDKLNFIAGCTGVSASQLYPYFPQQIAGLLAAIKGAAEYESMVNSSIGGEISPKYQQAQRRMAPQLVGHLLMVGLIIAGNTIFFARRHRGAA
ncbi:MAG: hypothetical protein K8R92_06315 [Planctomycetes bacterium]|nr:hypothetical protein [Planctomycetota bacterium]